MAKSTPNPKVDAILRKAKRWQQEMEQLRAIVLTFPLAEELKWGKPCYTFQNKNVLIIIGFKDSCALMFVKGALLKDADGILARPGENTRGSRWIKFNSALEIAELKSTLKSYIQEAIELEKSGAKLNFKRDAKLGIPEELQNQLDNIPALKSAFGALTPGRQRAYVLYFSAAKQSKTRSSRIEKCMPQILDGKGLND
jgi:uncharacterized protein YdeI (YjbR/CyaY-like superfamily)